MPVHAIPSPHHSPQQHTVPHSLSLSPSISFILPFTFITFHEMFLLLVNKHKWTIFNYVMIVGMPTKLSQWFLVSPIKTESKIIVTIMEKYSLASA